MSESSQLNNEQKPSIYTVTLSPELERTLVVHYLATGYQNRVTEKMQLSPSGHGVNIAKALDRLKTPSSAIVLLGNDATGKAYTSLVSEENFDAIVVHSTSATNSAMVIYDTGHNTETRIIEDRAEVNANDIAAVGELLQSLVEAGDYVVFAGALPDGISEDTYAYLIDLVQAKEAKVVLATSGPALENALAAAPELIMLTLRDLEGHFNYPIRNLQDICASARKLQERQAQRVLVVDDERTQAVLIEEEAQWLVELHEDDHIGTTSGVWDAFIAGYLTGRITRKALDESLELGAAAAAYTLNQVGNEFGTAKDIKTHTEEIDVVQIDPDDEPPALS